MSTSSKKTRTIVFIICLLAALIAYIMFGPVMAGLGRWLVLEERPVQSDAAVVLFGPGWYERLMEAAKLYRDGHAEQVVINGNRKTEAFRVLEGMGLKVCCPWYEIPVRALSLLGVPGNAVVMINAEDAYDTASEARLIGPILLKKGIAEIVLVTSKYHTRRANYVWNQTFSDDFIIHTVGASGDPFSPENWWKSRKQIRWVMAEYGAWLYYLWQGFGDRLD